MKANQTILRKTIKHFILWQPYTTSQKIKEHFELNSIKDFYTLLQDETSLKETIAKFCSLASLEIEWFRIMYESYVDGKIREDKFKIEFLKHKNKLNKKFIAN